jgi:hypothetical protein
MAKSSIPSPEESLAGMAKTGAPRKPMNRDGIKFTSPSASPKAGTLIKKKGAQAADPTVQGTGMRTNIPAGKDRNGAAYSIKSNYMRQTSPEAGATQANGRIFKSSTLRTNPNFNDGVGTSY